MTFSFFYKMESAQRKIEKLVDKIAKENNTKYMKRDVLAFISKHFHEFKHDYNSTSRLKRLTTGRLEKLLFILLGKLCKGSNRRGNSKHGSNIMISCGYSSYKKNPKRFVQKMENYKKKDKHMFAEKIDDERRGDDKRGDDDYEGRGDDGLSSPMSIFPEPGYPEESLSPPGSPHSSNSLLLPRTSITLHDDLSAENKENQPLSDASSLMTSEVVSTPGSHFEDILYPENDTCTVSLVPPSDYTLSTPRSSFYSFDRTESLPSPSLHITPVQDTLSSLEPHDACLIPQASQPLYSNLEDAGFQSALPSVCPPDNNSFALCRESSITTDSSRALWRDDSIPDLISTFNNLSVVNDNKNTLDVLSDSLVEYHDADYFLSYF